MVRVLGIGPSSQPWEGYIIATIRHPQKYLEPISGFGPLTYALRKRRSTS